MEAGCARGNRDDSHRLPTLSLGLSSVKLIVNKFEAGYARVASDAIESSRELVAYDPRAVEIDDDSYSSLGPSRDRVWSRFLVNLGFALSKCIPSVTLGNFTVLSVFVGFFSPRMFSYLVIYPFCRLVFGTLYPAYASYKAVRTKNLKEYVKWMMYWIVFALFTCTETFTDVFLSWFPFYYEVKIVLVLWLLSPATKGSSILYRKFVHPALCRREQEIDEYIAKAKDQGYHTVLNLGTKGVNYATTVIMQTAIKGGGGLVQQIRKSYSLSDLTECDVREERAADEADDVLSEPRVVRRVVKSSGYNTRRSASESNSRTPMYFPEVDVDVRGPRTARTDEPDFSHIKSTEDISSGYSSADNSASLTRTGSVGAGARVRARTTRTTVTTIKRPQAAEDNEVIIEELPDDDTFDYANMPPLVHLPPHLFLSDTDPPFIYEYVGDQIKIVQVLGNYPLGVSLNQNNVDHRDQKDTIDLKSTEKSSPDRESIQDEFENAEDDLGNDNTQVIIENNHKDTETNEFPNTESVTGTTTNFVEQDKEAKEQEPEIKKEDQDQNKDSIVLTSDHKNDSTNTEKKSENNMLKTSLTADEREDTTSLDTSAYENDSAESDDEASFGTPDNSPRSKRKSKSPKGKYGKGKAPPPPPPKIGKTEVTTDIKETVDVVQDKPVSVTSQESLNDIINALPNNGFKETGTHQGLQVVNPIAEKKRRHKSKSPGRIPKGNASGIGKLLQIPSKLAFWHKSDDKSKSDSTSNPSRSRSHSKSSTYEATEINDDTLSFADAADFESEVIAHDIMEKSDALQKLIEAKIESHPEYKFVSLHDEIPTTSKSTDV